MAVINTNIASINAQNNLSKSQNNLQTSLQRLSSGLRINSAKDDAAGLAISDRMTSQIRGLNQAVRNANDGISLAQTAEGAMSESTNILQRMRELAIQSANDTNSASDRANLQKEVVQLQSELNRIADTTSFNGKNILDGTFTSGKFHVGAEADQVINVSIGSTRATSMGNYSLTTGGTGSTAVAAAATAGASTTVAGEDLTISGPLGSTTTAVDVAAGDSAKTVAAKVNAVQSDTGVTAKAVSQAKITSVSAGNVAFTLTGDTTGGAQAITANGVTSTDVSALSEAINAKTGTTGITAELSSDKTSITLISANGDDIIIEGATNGADGTNVMTVQGLNADSTNSGAAATLVDASTTATNTDSTRVAGDVTFSASGTFTVTSGAAGGLFAATTANTSTLSSVAAIDISSQTGSNNALDVIDQALAFMAGQRADLGAVQNRLESTISNLSSISENVTAARSRIQDADFAAETANLTKNQILQQAGTAMLAQANTLPQGVLSLLQ
ncbi:flagellin [Amphritea atlantica]|uniref:Flagellin n=1 Tax=Amphritea atlantica TaxID=355243 RepID=A0A1H9L955_9GAMM|nr:flagellin [Amphritea atlantica]SER07934.1 flagellin [Amphritea atlantica]